MSIFPEKVIIFVGYNETYTTMSKKKGTIIVFANQKGGVGKTTLCALFANRLAEAHVDVTVKDADLQASIVTHRKDELAERPTQVVPWAVEWVDATKDNGMKKRVERWRDDHDVTVVDAPGSLALSGMLPILGAATTVVVPMTYDPDVLASTLSFLKVMRKVNKKVQIVIVPNRIDPRVGNAEERAREQQATATLRTYGFVAPMVKQLAAVKRYSTLLPNDRQQTEATEGAFQRVLAL